MHGHDSKQLLLIKIRSTSLSIAFCVLLLGAGEGMCLLRAFYRKKKKIHSRKSLYNPAPLFNFEADIKDLPERRAVALSEELVLACS